MTSYSLEKKAPETPANGRYWVAPSADVIGNVSLGLDSSVWFGAVLRGDNELISIGNGSNIQDRAIIHTDPGFPCEIGDGVTVGHGAILHGCKIGENALIGMGATVLNGAVIGRNCLVGAGALITEGKQFEEGMLILGSPAKAVRPLDDTAIEGLRQSAQTYVMNARRYKAELEAQKA